MKVLGRKSRNIGLGASLLAGLGVASYVTGRRSVPSWSGIVRLPGLSGDVEVLRDAHGVPAIFAENERDLFVVQGYVHASDRLFQMDLMRRIATGQVAEVVGEPGLRIDRLMRVLGFGRTAEAEYASAPEQVRMAVDAYAEGVNGYIERSRRRLPMEFSLVGYKPERWRPQDCYVFPKMFALGLCGNWEAEMVRAEIAQKFGADVVALLDEDEHTRPFVPQIDPAVLGELHSAAREATSILGSDGVGSNNWVVGPRRTSTGGALLANDTHLELQLPSTWYEMALRSPTYAVRGFSVAGSPGVAIGHNGTIAWGFTNSCADVQDLYVEELDEQAGTYKDVDGDGKLQVRTEVIEVKDAEPVRLKVRSTRRGPIITDAVDNHLEHAYSIRWDSTLKPGRLMEGLFAVNRATDWDSFREGMRLWTSPSQNAVYADRNQNIGFQLMGEIPVRRGGDGRMPYRGDDPEGEWTGVIPFDELPHTFNPSSDMIVTANDRITGDSYPHFISREWMNGYRGERIRDLLAADDQHTVEGQVGIQCDLHSLPGERLVAALKDREIAPATEHGRAALRELLAWDTDLAPDSSGGAVYGVLMRLLQERTFNFLDDLLPGFLGKSRTFLGGFWSMYGRSVPRIVHAIESDDLELLRMHEATDAAAHGQSNASGNGAAASRPAEKTWNHLLADLLDEVGSRLVELDGSNSAQWRWDSVHRMRWAHPLGAVPAVARLVNRGTHPIGGDSDTVWQTSLVPKPDNEYALVGPAMRVVYDLADLDRSKAVLAGGISGHAASPFYDDQIPLWREGRMRPAPWSRTAIEKIAVYTQQFPAQG